MSSFENLVGLTLQAMTASLSSATPSAQRHEAQAYLQNLSDSVECSSVLQTILSQDTADSYGYKMLSLSMLHDWMKKWWVKITPTEHMQIRTFVCQILSQPVLRSQPSNFRSKFAAILSEIAERQFPQHWPSMMEDFLQIVHRDIEVYETIVRVIIFIYTDCTDQDFQNQLPTVRRQEVMAGLKVYEDKLIYLVYSHMVANIPHIQQLAAPDPTQIAVITRSINLALELLETIIPVVSVDKIVSPAQNCLVPVCVCLSISGVQIQASSCLSTLLSKKLSAHILANNPQIIAVYMQTLASCRVTALPSDAGDRYIFIKQYVCALSTFIEHHLASILADDSRALLDEVAVQVMQAMQAPGN
ncbi:hypothetical protein EON65_20170 [archaeon]|nr:MAG: hypothetical protein EON65_20170 [archaeon]